MRVENKVPLLLGLSVCYLLPAQARKAYRPNILFILCDDMGYGDLACYGQPYINTPNIDRLAAEGMRFTQAYAGSPVSAPSRAALMTGQHTGHTHVRGNREYWRGRPLVCYGKNKEPDRVGQEPYDSRHIVLPEIMKKNGYATAVFGKWAGGYEGSPSTPDKRGVDEFYGYICQYMAHMYYPNFLNRYSKRLNDTATVRVELTDNTKWGTDNAGYARRTQYSGDMIHQEALRWIDNQHRDRPFFGMLTYTLPHAELYQPNDSILQYYKAKFRNDINFRGIDRYHANTHMHAQFAAMITRLDTYVGEMMEHLKQRGLDKNTIVIFSSDNGPHEEGGADPAFFGRDGKLRGLKRSCYEGGIRVPFIVRWPGHVAQGKVNGHQLAFYDVLPTFCHLLGHRADEYLNPTFEDDCFDGISFLPTLLGKDKKQREHDHLYWEFHETDQMAVRQGDWKLVVRKGKCELYDLSSDIHEDRNVAACHPDVVKRMVRIIKSEHRDSKLFKVTQVQSLY